MGWESAIAHGVGRLVDLRFEGEGAGEPGPPDDIEVVGVSLFGPPDPDRARRFDDRMREADDVAAVFAASYINTLERSPGVIAEAVAAVADSDPARAVVVHCFAGKDRTGIVTALLLGAAGVPDEAVASDYAASGPGVEVLSAPWFARSDSDDVLALRRRVTQSPHAAMVAVLAWLRANRGGVEAYLRDAGIEEAQLKRLRLRLLEK